MRLLARVDRWLLEMRPVTRWLAIGLLVSLTLLLTAWVCWVTEPEAPSPVPQRSDESKVVQNQDLMCSRDFVCNALQTPATGQSWSA